MDRLTNTEAAISELAERAVRRIGRFYDAHKTGAVATSDFLVQVAQCIGAAKAALDDVTTAALPAEVLHNRINAALVAAGIARWNGSWLMVVR